MAYTIMVAKTGDWPPEGSSFTDRIKALKGKRIGVSGIGAGTDHALILMLKSVGLSEKDVTRIGIGEQQAAIGQLSAGAIDAFVSFSLSGNAIIEQQTGARRYAATFDPDSPQAKAFRKLTEEVARQVSIEAMKPELVVLGKGH